MIDTPMIKQKLKELEDYKKNVLEPFQQEYDELFRKVNELKLELEREQVNNERLRDQNVKLHNKVVQYEKAIVRVQNGGKL